MINAKGLTTTSVIFITALAPVFAQNTIWISDGSNTDWSNASNWNNGVPDTNAEAAFFFNDDGAKTTLVNQNYTIKRIEFLDGGSMTSGYTINSGGNTLTVDVNSNNVFTDAVSNKSSFTQTINANLSFTNSGTGAAATLTSSAAAGTTVYNGTLTSNTGTALNFGGFGDINVNGNVVNNGGLRFGSASTITFAGAGTTSGTTGNVNFFNGSVVLNRASAISGGSYLFNGANVTLGVDSAFATASNLIASGDNAGAPDAGLLDTGGFDATFAVLDLDDAFTIDLGEGDSDLVFADSSGQTWDGSSLTVSGYTEGADSIRFGTDTNGLTGAQLAKITVNGISGITLDDQGFIIIPEPSITTMLIGALIGTWLYTTRRKKRGA